MTGFGIDPLRYLTGPEHHRAVLCFASYMNDCTGAWFGHLSDPDPDHITAADLVAVTTLSVEVPAAAAVWIHQHSEDIHEMLTAVPNVSITEIGEADLGEGSAALRLWLLLQSRRWPEGEAAGNGVGAVTAGKLLAAKRPSLIPIWDQWVQEGLRPPTGQFWTEMWRRFQATSFADQVDQVRCDGLELCRSEHIEVSSEPTLLRTLDIVVWMRGYGHTFSRRPEVRSLATVPLGLTADSTLGCPPGGIRTGGRERSPAATGAETGGTTTL